ncbi:type II secretion system protein GspM [Craterilacuibacter sp. RT1T]|uniref:type II secretion system protein GspM n=1 Tax=Craterilacuibacter sp. RT1T TaxID=2942211 RepID=UPI0020BEB88D|nr:type II secretion system protein GspM [Craterilacuibacter sp. RT1T]MCL6263590.1 type II secretion system protein M [Craterilacuibacter sp. RT1T]
MHAWKKTLLARWRQLTLREQRMLGVMSAVLLLAMAYLLLWEPASRYVVKTRSQVARLEAELVFDRKLMAEANALKRQPLVATLNAADLQTLIERSAKAQPLPGSWTLAAEGEQGVRISGELPFDAWLGFAGQLALQQVRVLRMKTAASTAPGMVKLDAVLVHGGGRA